MVTVHVDDLPLHPPPDQYAKYEPEVAAAVRVTDVLYVYVWEHVEPQLIPAGDEVTVPEPAPVFNTVRVSGDGVGVGVIVGVGVGVTVTVGVGVGVEDGQATTAAYHPLKPPWT